MSASPATVSRSTTSLSVSGSSRSAVSGKLRPLSLRIRPFDSTRVTRRSADLPARLLADEPDATLVDADLVADLELRDRVRERALDLRWVGRAIRRSGDQTHRVADADAHLVADSGARAGARPRALRGRPGSGTPARLARGSASVARHHRPLLGRVVRAVDANDVGAALARARARTRTRGASVGRERDHDPHLAPARRRSEHRLGMASQEPVAAVERGRPRMGDRPQARIRIRDPRERRDHRVGEPRPGGRSDVRRGLSPCGGHLHGGAGFRRSSRRRRSGQGTPPAPGGPTSTPTTRSSSPLAPPVGVSVRRYGSRRSAGTPGTRTSRSAVKERG